MASNVPRIDLRLLRQYVAVAEELHFRRAAERLAMSQPPLTATIRRLEEEVGAVLIERGKKTVRLTAAGNILLIEARRILAAATGALEATRDAAEGRLGRVRLGYVGSAMYGRLPKLIRQFRRTHPSVRLELREMTTAAQVAAIRSGDLDLAIVILPVGDAADLVTSPFDKDCLVVALPTSNRLAIGGVVAMSALREEPVISWPRAQGAGFHDLVTRLFMTAGFLPNVVQEAHGMHGVLSLVAVEAGVAIVPGSMAAVRPNEVAYRPIAGEAAEFHLLLCRSSRPLDPAPAEFARVLA